jgi:CRP/FNR family transcriptional regulator, cyclic AMP receptor protein
MGHSVRNPEHSDITESQWPSFTLLGQLSGAERQLLLECGTNRRYAPGDLLIREGELSTYVLVLLDGVVKVTGSPADGSVVLLSVRIAGDLIGELAALDDEPRSATVQAVTTVTARVIAQRSFVGLLGEQPRIAGMVHRAIGGKLRMATRHRIDISGSRMYVRLARVIDSLVCSYGQPDSDGVRIGFPLRQTDLASLVGGAEPRIHRELTRLRREKVLVTRYRQLLVTDPQRLRTIAVGDQ